MQLACIRILSLCICVSDWQRPPPLTEPEENALVCEPTVRMMGTVIRFAHRRIQHCSVSLRTRQRQAPAVWLVTRASGSESENSMEGYFQGSMDAAFECCIQSVKALF